MALLGAYLRMLLLLLLLGYCFARAGVDAGFGVSSAAANSVYCQSFVALALALALTLTLPLLAKLLLLLLLLQSHALLLVYSFFFSADADVVAAFTVAFSVIVVAIHRVYIAADVAVFYIATAAVATVTAAAAATVTVYAVIVISVVVVVVVAAFVCRAAAATFVFLRSLRAFLPFYVQLCFYFLFVGLFMSQKIKTKRNTANADNHLLCIYLYICVRIPFTFY